MLKFLRGLGPWGQDMLSYMEMGFLLENVENWLAYATGLSTGNALSYIVIETTFL